MKNITRIVNGQEFSLIRYVAGGQYFTTWYPTENLSSLKCVWAFEQMKKTKSKPLLRFKVYEYGQDKLLPVGETNSTLILSIDHLGVLRWTVRNEYIEYGSHTHRHFLEIVQDPT